MENEKRLEDALSDVKAELSELKMALNEITDRYDTYWNLNMTEAIKFYRGDTGNKVGEASCRVLFEHDRIMWLVRTARGYASAAFCLGYGQGLKAAKAEKINGEKG